MSRFNYNEPSLGVRDTFTLDLTRLNQVIAAYPSVGPVNADEMSRVLSLAAQATRIPMEFFETVLALEAGYPDRATYSSRMPRDGDGSKPLPDPRYPHPSAWSARPPSKGRPAGPYYGLANVNRGTQIYIGVSQMSFDFYSEVKVYMLKKGVNRQYLPSRWWEAPLLIQLVAPLVYFEIYKSNYPQTALVTPSTVYMLHQQGPGWVKQGMRDLAGRQSVQTATIVKQARQASRGYF